MNQSSSSTVSQSTSGGSSSSLASLDGDGAGSGTRTNDVGSTGSVGGANIGNNTNNSSSSISNNINASRRKRWLRHARTAKERSERSVLGGVGSVGTGGSSLLKGSTGVGNGNDDVRGTNDDTKTAMEKVASPISATKRIVRQTSGSSNLEIPEPDSAPVSPSTSERIVNKNKAEILAISDNDTIGKGVHGNENESKTKKDRNQESQSHTKEQQFTQTLQQPEEDEKGEVRNKMIPQQTQCDINHSMNKGNTQNHSKQNRPHQIQSVSNLTHKSLQSTNNANQLHANIAANNRRRIQGSSFGGVASKSLFSFKGNKNSKISSPDRKSNSTTSSPERNINDSPQNPQKSQKTTKKPSSFNFDDSHFVNYTNQKYRQYEEDSDSISEDEDAGDDHYFRMQPDDSNVEKPPQQQSTELPQQNQNQKHQAPKLHQNVPPPPPPPPPPPLPRQDERPQHSQNVPNHGRNHGRNANLRHQSHGQHNPKSHVNPQTKLHHNPTLEPYIARLEKFELFSTHQCYYLVACDKHSTTYRIMKMDRTLIERPPGSTGIGGSIGTSGAASGNVSSGAKFNSVISSRGAGNVNSSSSSPGNKGSPSFDSSTDSDHGEGLISALSATSVGANASPKTSATVNEHSISPNNISSSDAAPKPQNQQQYPHSPNQQQQLSNQQQQNQQHNQKTTFRRLSEFVTEDPSVYSQSEIKDVLDMINDGNRLDDGHYYGMHGAGIGGGVSAGGHDPSFRGVPHPGGPHRTMGGDGGNSGNGRGRGGGGLKPICKAYGVLGFIRFLDCYYLTLITKRAKVGSIGGNSIYTIKSTETFPLKPAERSSSSSASSENVGNDPSSMLLSMWNRGKRSVGLGLSNREIAELRYQGLYQVVDLTKNFFFSYTYDLTRSLQDNFLAMSSQPFPPGPFKDMYAWNFFLTRELEECTNSLTAFHWCLPVVHGAFIQRKLHDYGRSLNLILLARRSRHFAGTRYLKRGVSDRGKVANDVEHEQIIHDESTSEGVFSSFLQIRGSIPTFWTQESSVTMPKPPIVLNRVDPTYQATQAHFEDLLKRYGSPIIVVDLVKQSEKRERETIVGNEFRNSIDYINGHIDDQHKILYCALDYSHISKHRNLNVSSSLNDVATWSVNQTGFFCSSPKWKIVEGGAIEPFDEECYRGSVFLSHRLGVPFFPMEQLGILRTNCIDCLDRTNVAQFSAGVEALGQQLVVMGIRSSPKLDPSSIIVRMLIDMYVEIGDQIALQYGGSEAHKKVASAGTNSNIPGPMGKHKELLTSIRRYYSNAFTDRLKQDAMNLFLGYYIPSHNSTPLWELDNDYYLHNFHVNSGRGMLQSMKGLGSKFGVDWGDLDDECITERDKQLPSLVHKRNESTTSLLTDEQGRLDRVKLRCKAQQNALSYWWKIAIHSYIQQRMWMQLGGNPTGSSLPPRFDRLYHPSELSQFDKFFSRPWATPSRLSHEDQHKLLDEFDGANISPRKASPKESKITLYEERVQSSRGHKERAPQEEEEEEGTLSLKDYVDVHGFNSKNRTSLNHLLEAHNYNIHGRSKVEQPEKPVHWRDYAKMKYLGNLKEKVEPCSEYHDYASSALMPRRPFRPLAREEFAACLNDTTLDSNDVQGIRKLAESAHICRELQSGPYRGLNQNESAVKVATTVHGHYNYLEEKVEEGLLTYDLADPPGLLEKLKHENLYSVGVTESFYAGWMHLAKAEKTYSEIVDMSSVGYRRSDTTTDSSMRLYSSFFDESTPVTQLEQVYATGQKVLVDPSKPLRRSTRPCEKVSGPNDKDLKSFDESSFILKAASRGINIRKSYSNKAHPQIPSGHNQFKIPAGFEQINEDLFARKDNKFMVFNGAGVNSWKSPPQPVTKTHGVEPWVFK